MLFGHWFPPHVAVSMVYVMSHGAVQRCKGYIDILEMNTKITTDNVIDLFLFVLICIYCIYVFIFGLLCYRGPSGRLVLWLTVFYPL